MVEAIGEGVEGLKAGDRVVYSGGPGAYATRRISPADRLVKIPDFVKDEDAAAVFLKGLTAWMLLFEIRQPKPGETVLVWAAAGGVGSLLVPWANALGARVIGVVSTADKAELAKGYGCDEVVLASEDVAARVRELTGGAGVPVSYDSVGKSSAEASLQIAGAERLVDHLRQRLGSPRSGGAGAPQPGRLAGNDAPGPLPLHPEARRPRTRRRGALGRHALRRREG